MKIRSLGHVVLRVTDRDRSERFYNGVLGLPICARLDQGGMKMAFFSLGNHHVDASQVWRTDPQRVAQVKPLQL
jgi:catechol-2,3-dioxygenase